ncbi:MFS transporter [Nocardioides sp. YIM 152588]|uniref:MFS transporter n=1 Tax=Nocardioides sp. YIM 152588 TaxID=3158259 RepID=UPI0032E4171E
MLDTYRAIFTRASAAFSLTGLVARLPISMVGLGIVLLAEDVSGSYAFAGSVSAVALIANAALAIPQGRLIDRFGQGRVLSLVITLWGVALAATMWSLQAGWPHPVTYLIAAVAGASLPSVGTCVRARWSHTLADQPSRLHTAFSFEAVADETTFLVGPIAVTLLATSVHPAAGLVAALVAGTLGTYAFSAQRGTEPPPHPRRAGDARRPPMPWRAIAPLTLASIALGVVFGAAEVTTVAFADEQGRQGLAGVLLALWALGSLLSGLASGAISWRSSTLTRLRFGALALACSMAPLVVAPNLGTMAVLLMISGLAVSPTLIATMSLAEQVLPTSRMTEGMAFLQTGLAAGVAPGAALAGIVIDGAGASPAYLICVGGGTAALLAALLLRVGATVRSHDERVDGSEAGHVA